MQSIMGSMPAMIDYANYFHRVFESLSPQNAAMLSDQAAQQILGPYAGAEAVAQQYPPNIAQALMHSASVAFTEGKSVAFVLALVLMVLSAVLVAWKFPRQRAEQDIYAKLANISAAEMAASAPA